MKATAAALVAVLATTASALELTLDRSGIEQAIRIGQLREERDRSREHAPYRLIVGKAPVDYIDVVTPFRRVALAAEQQTRTGRSFGQRQAIEILGTRPAEVEFLVELTFHPMNTMIGIPDYEVTLQQLAAKPLRPRSLDRVPRFGPRVQGAPLPAPGTFVPHGNQPMLGGTVIATFDGNLLQADGRYDVVLFEKGKELVRVRADLARMR